MDLKKLCYDLPKIELHAHLNGSLSPKTLEKLGALSTHISEYDLSKTSERSLEGCFQLFSIAHQATNNRNAVYEATKSVIKEFAEDNVVYLELRTTPRSEKHMSKVEYIESVVEAIKESGDNIIVKLLLSIDRKFDDEEAWETMNVIIKMKTKYPDIIKGVDLSGNPTVGKFDAELFSKAKENNLAIAIHCAEVKNDQEVLEILNFKPDRIGHATNIHPDYGGSEEIWNLYQQLQIPIECCLTSNVICRTAKSYKEHHVQEWLAASLPFSLNTDDKGVFNTSLSEEYLHAAENFNLSIQDLQTISYNSVEHSFASPQEKDLLRSRLKKWWKTHECT